MPRIRYTADGGHYRVAGVGFDPGDERDVDADLAEYLTDRDDFEAIEQTDGPVGQEDEPPDETGSDDENSDEFDAEAWLDEDYGDRADRVRAGDVDAHLEAIAEAETSDTVLDAIGERRAELATETEG